MATFSSVTRSHVLQAIADCDDRGQDAFLAVHGYTRTHLESFEHEGKVYDSRAILGVAHKYATGRLPMAEEFKSDDVAARFLVKNGFDASSPAYTKAAAAPKARAAGAAAPKTPRAAAAPRTTRRAAVEEVPPAICPTCFTQLPATGICDNCA